MSIETVLLSTPASTMTSSVVVEKLTDVIQTTFKNISQLYVPEYKTSDLDQKKLIQLITEREATFDKGKKEELTRAAKTVLDQAKLQ